MLDSVDDHLVQKISQVTIDVYQIKQNDLYTYEVLSEFDYNFFLMNSTSSPRHYTEWT